MVRVVARNAVSEIGASFQMNAAFYRESDTTVRKIGSDTKSAHADDLSWDADFTVGPSAAVLEVTGANGQTIAWRSITFIL